MKFIKTERKEHVAVLTIERRDALNAINRRLLSDLSELLDEIEADADIYVVVLTGAGRAFAAGADIVEMQELSAYEGKQFSIFGARVFDKLENLSRPVIAAVNGYALGGGCELAMACDIRLASEKAKFGQPEVKLGITPGFGGTQRLPRIVGISRAMEMVLTGRTIDAAEARSIGLVNEIYPQNELLDRALALAAEISLNAQIAVKQSKRCIRVGMQTDISTGSAFEAEAFGITCATADKAEGMGAFLEKRATKKFTNC